MRALIIDDERLAREEMKRLLNDFVEIDVVGEAKNAKEAKEKIALLTPDVIFCDIQMPGTNGLDLIKEIDDETTQVVFVSAHEQHAAKAFDISATDYLLKPVEIERLKETIEKLSDSNEEFTSSMTPTNRKERRLNYEDKVFIKDGEKCFFVATEEIRFFESQGNYVQVYFKNKKPLILRSLNSLEERLNPEQFFRVNRKYIINLDWISKIDNWFNGGLQITLKEGEKIDVSRRQASKFKDIFSI